MEALIILVSILFGMSKKLQGLFFVNPKTRGNCKTFCSGTDEGPLRAKRAENICDDDFYISFKYI